MKTISFKSDITGTIYPANEYINHGYGGMKQGKKDLPHDEYPYTEIVEQHKNILFSPTTLPFDIVKCECGKFYFDKNYCIIRFTSPSVTKVPKL